MQFNCLARYAYGLTSSGYRCIEKFILGLNLTIAKDVIMGDNPLRDNTKGLD